MSSDSSDQELSNKKSSKEDKEPLKKTNLKLRTHPAPAGTSNTHERELDRSHQDETSEWNFFPQNMWFWKQEEPQQEVLLQNWSMNSQQSLGVQGHSQQVKKGVADNIWPHTINTRDTHRLLNQPTLSQIIEQRKLRENQLIFGEEYSKEVDYLGERMSKSKINILIAQLNNTLPKASEENADVVQNLSRSKPLRVKQSSSSTRLERKTSKVSEHLTPEELTQREQLRDKQLQEYENLRDQIVLEARTSPTKFNTSNITLKQNHENTRDETISKTELNKLIELLNASPSESKHDITTLQKLILSKPHIVKLLQIHKKTNEEIARQEQLRQKQIQEFEALRTQIGLYGDKPALINVNSTTRIIEESGENIMDGIVSKTELEKIVTQLNETNPLQMQNTTRLLRKKVSMVENLSPKEIALQQELRQEQMQEFNNLRDHIGLFGEEPASFNTTTKNIEERSENILEESISKTKIQNIVAQLNKTNPNETQKTTSLLCKKESKISESLSSEKVARQKQLRENQLQEFENLRNQVDLFGERSGPVKFNAATKSTEERSENLLEESVSKTELKKIVTQRNEQKPVPMQKSSGLFYRKVSSLFHRKASERLTLEETAEREQLRNNQLQEYENLRRYIGLFGEKSTLKNASGIPLQDNREVPHHSERAQKEISLHGNSVEGFASEETLRQKKIRENQIQKYEDLCDKIDIFGE